MPGPITFERTIGAAELTECFRKITFRGLYDETGQRIRPYANAKFSLAKVHPPVYPTSFPQIIQNLAPNPLFTAQPTIYKNQTDIMRQIDGFLQTMDRRIFDLGFEGIQYHWEGKGSFHVLPPIVEKHQYDLQDGAFDLKKMAKRFTGTYVKDAQGNLHELSKRTLRDFYVDPDSKISYLDVFNHSAELINYGLQFNGPFTFYIVCDGAHRLDYALEVLNQPINVILVENEELFPYYAFPVPFRPTTRLTSKEAEKMYPKLERDKVHLLNDFIKKILHYDWEVGQLHVSSLRQQATIH